VTADADRDMIRAVARALLRQPVPALREVRDAWAAACNARRAGR
jgi:hypothetical protein